MSGSSVDLGSSGVSNLNNITGAVMLVAGSNVTITPSGSNLTIASSGGGGGSGTVTSVALADSTGIFNISGSPITTSGTLTLASLASQSAKTFLAAPNASSGTPSFRAIVASDIPTLAYVASVSGTAPVVSSGGATPAISMAAATTSVDGYLTSTNFTTFNNKANSIIPTTNQMVFVNYLTGNDSTGTGAYDKAYKTVAFAMTTITDASSNKPYVIALQAERQIETTDVLMKPYTFIVGQMQRATYIRINGGSLKPDPSHSTGNSWVGLSNLYLGGSTAVAWDLQAIGGNNCVFVVQNCTLSGAFTYKGRNAGGGDYLEAYVGVIIGSLILDSVNSQIQSMELASTTTLTNTQAISMSTSFNNVIFDGNVSVTSAGTSYANNCCYLGGATLTTIGTNTLDSYRGLPPTTSRTLSVGTTVTNRDDASIIPYSPADTSKWALPYPTNAQQALDRMAAVVGLTVPIP